MIILCRKTTVTSQQLPDGNLLLHGQFEDENHLIDAQVTVDRGTGHGTSTYATMGRTPYGEVCHRPLAAAGQLVGVTIGKGSSRQVAAILGGPNGCTHLVDLVIEVFRAYVPSLARLEEFRLTDVYTGEGLPAGQVREKVFGDIRDLGRRVIPETCAAYHVEAQGKDKAKDEKKDQTA